MASRMNRLKSNEVGSLPSDGAEAGDLSEEEIVERIFEAVIDQRLPAGSKLSESVLCKAFGTGRMRIRRSLLLLASRGIVELRANRGAFVARPTGEQAREVFEARRAIEPNVIRHAVARASEADIQALGQHLRAETAANHEGRRRDAIRLSGHFHVLLAQVAGNSVMLAMMRELVARTSLIIGIFGGPGPTSCRFHDHNAILEALAARDAEAAAAQMIAHLEDIQASIDLREGMNGSVDLVSLFSRG